MAHPIILPWLLPSLLLMLLLLLRADSAHAQAQSGTWSPTGSMTTARFFHTATRLANGKVLVAGGYNQVSSAELYDPATGTWSVTGSLNVGRAEHTATLLSTGQVLAAGGYDPFNFVSSAELYNPATGTWSLTGSMSTARADHTATLLSTGQVLAAGGFGGSNPLQGNPLASAELYNQTSGADLALTMTDTPDPVKVKTTLTYALTVTNKGPSTATGVKVTDTLPSGVTFGSAVPSQGSCSGSAPVTCSLGGLAVNASATITIKVTPTATGTITNTANVSGNEPDPSTSNNTATTTTGVNTSGQPWHLTVTIQGQGTVTSSPPGINCGTQCDAVYSNGTVVTLTAAPASGWKFDHWERGCSGTTSSCAITMTEDTQVKAVFAKP